MKKTIKKVFVSFVVGATLLTYTYTPALASKITVNMPYSIYESKESQHVSSGVVHEKILKFTTSGWWHINVLRIDLKDEYTELKGLINPNGIPSRDRVTTLLNKHNAVAGVNGDYFNYQPLPSAMGALINNGELISSPVEMAYKLPSFYLTESNMGAVGYLDRNMIVENLSTGEKILINTVNKVSPDFSTVTLLNNHWGSKSIGNRFHQDLVEVLVVDDIVKDIRIGGEAFDIPKENGYVLGVRGDKLSGLKVHDKVDLKINTTPTVEDIKFAIGGGSIILQNGELSLTNIISKGNEPRTGIGINRDNTEIILVTIDGRDNSFKGVSQEMFGAILRGLGAYNALNLDGGGSTSMAIRPAGENAQLVNKPSDGAERAVVNAVGVISNAPKGQLSYLKVNTDDSKMFLNTSRNFAVKGFDEYHNPVEIDLSQVVYTLEGVEGTFENNKLKATSSGKAIVTADYNGIKGSMNINVLGEIKDLNTKLTNFTIDINSEKPLSDFYGRDKNGYESIVYKEDIEFTITNEIGYMQNGVFYSGSEPLGGAITAKAGQGIENILVSVGSKGTLVESFENIDNFTFSTYPRDMAGSIELSNNAKEGNNSIVLNYDFSQGENTRVAYVNMDLNNGGLKLPGYPKKFGLWVKGDGNGSWLRGSLKDSTGKEFLFDLAKSVEWNDWQYIVADIPSNVSYPIALERIYVAEINSLRKQSGQILFDGLQAFYPSPIGNMVLPTATSLVDSQNQKSKVEKDGFTFAITTEPKGLNELVGYDANSIVKSRFSKSKLGFLFNGASDEFKVGLKNYALVDTSISYKTNKHYDALFINLSSTKNGIRAANPDQWIKLTNDLNNRLETNIVIFLPTPIFGNDGFTDTLEADLFHKKLVEAKDRGKNIFVVHGGSNSTKDLKDGIRYIGLKTEELTSPEDIYDLNIVEFVVNGKNISYEISPLFQGPKISVSK